MIEIWGDWIKGPIIIFKITEGDEKHRDQLLEQLWGETVEAKEREGKR